MNLLTLEDLKAKTKLKKSAIYKRIKDKTLPAPSKIGGASRWPEHEVNAALQKLADDRVPS